MNRVIYYCVPASRRLILLGGDPTTIVVTVLVAVLVPVIVEVIVSVVIMILVALDIQSVSENVDVEKQTHAGRVVVSVTTRGVDVEVSVVELSGKVVEVAVVVVVSGRVVVVIVVLKIGGSCDNMVVVDATVFKLVSVTVESCVVIDVVLVVIIAVFVTVATNKMSLKCQINWFMKLTRYGTTFHV
jgi:hypothetical protein